MPETDFIIREITRGRYEVVLTLPDSEMGRMLIQRGLLMSAGGIDFEVISGRTLALFEVSEPDFRTVHPARKRALRDLRGSNNGSL